MGSIADWIHVHRRGEVVPPTNGQAAHHRAPCPRRPCPSAQPPLPLPAAALPSAAPSALVLGSLGLFAIIVAAGSTHLVIARRRLLAAEAADGPDDSEGAWGAHAGEESHGGPGTGTAASADDELPSRRDTRPQRTGHKH